MKCQRCQANRSRLYSCRVCDKKLCGCCSFKRDNGIRVCPGDCHQESILIDSPKDLSKLTPEQAEASIKFLSTRPLSELRFRQDFISRMIKQYGGTSTLTNLQIMERHLTEAILRKEFSE